MAAERAVGYACIHQALPPAHQRRKVHARARAFCGLGMAPALALRNGRSQGLGLVSRTHARTHALSPVSDLAHPAMGGVRPIDAQHTHTLLRLAGSVHCRGSRVRRPAGLHEALARLTGANYAPGAAHRALRGSAGTEACGSSGLGQGVGGRQGRAGQVARATSSTEPGFIFQLPAMKGTRAISSEREAERTERGAAARSGAAAPPARGKPAGGAVKAAADAAPVTATTRTLRNMLSGDPLASAASWN